MISKKNPTWLEVHIKLQASMKKEIDIMREILGNMHQEEYFLLSHDKISRVHVLEERSLLLTKFNAIRNTRLLDTETLEALSLTASLEESLSHSEEESCETLFLRDQLVALFERMNMQNTRNQLLSKISEQMDVSRPELSQPAKKKISIVTITRKEIE